mmetsp:Transcript_43841/g.103699  ORF Transcript_43841/g.103699 Transcript_43841/m.103699 type:complete len:402 (+) Transcript_43841:218-1423(+)
MRPRSPRFGASLGLAVDVEHGLVAQLLPLEAVFGNVREKFAESGRAVGGSHHVLSGVVASDPRELRSVFEVREEVSEEVNSADNRVEHPDRYLDVLGLAAKHLEEHLRLLQRGHCLPGPAHWQNLVVAILDADAVSHDLSEVSFGDGVGLADLPVTEHDVRLPILHEADLASKRLEEGSRTHDAVRDTVLSRDRLLQLKLRALEFEERLLDADGAEQHVVRASVFDKEVEAVFTRLVVYEVGVGDTPRARRQTRYHHIHLAAVKSVLAKRVHVRHVAERAGSTGKVSLDVLLRLLATHASLGAREGDNVVAALDQLLGHEASDVARRPRHQHRYILGLRLRNVLGHHGGGTERRRKEGATSRGRRRDREGERRSAERGGGERRAREEGRSEGEGRGGGEEE